MCNTDKKEFEKNWALLCIIQELEQPCDSLNRIKEFLDEAHLTHNRIDTYLKITKYGIKVCSHADIIESIDAQPLEYIKKLSKKTIQEQLLNFSLYPFNALNANYREKNNGNSLLHALCEQKLDDQEFETISNFLAEKNIELNCLNTKDLTPLAYGLSLNISNNKQEILKKLGCKDKTNKNQKVTFTPDTQEH